jgi:hypothetical protein
LLHRGLATEVLEIAHHIPLSTRAIGQIGGGFWAGALITR